MTFASFLNTLVAIALPVYFLCAAYSAWNRRWRPIKTAPRNAKRILVCRASPFPCYAVVVWNADYGEWAFDISYEGLPITPTHWMPLKKAPAGPYGARPHQFSPGAEASMPIRKLREMTKEEATRGGRLRNGFTNEEVTNDAIDAAYDQRSL